MLQAGLEHMIFLHFPTCWNCRYVPACLAVEHLCSPLNMLGFCSGMQFNYLETVWVFWMLLIRIVGWDKTVQSNQAHYSLPVSQDTSVLIPSKLWSMRHSSLAGGNGSKFQVLGTVHFYTFSLPWMASLYACIIRTHEHWSSTLQTLNLLLCLLESYLSGFWPFKHTTFFLRQELML